MTSTPLPPARPPPPEERDPSRRDLACKSIDLCQSFFGSRLPSSSLTLRWREMDSNFRFRRERHGEKADLLAGARNLTRDLEACGGGYLRLPHRRDVDDRKVAAHLADAMRWCKSMPERGEPTSPEM